MTGKRRPWAADELVFLRALYPDSPTLRLAKALGRPLCQVYGKAHGLGLSKSKKFLASQASGRLDGDSAIANRFPKGHVPANKGLRRPGYAPGRMGATQFKKGRAASEARNYVPIGTEKLDKGGLLIRKVTDDPNLFPARRWVPVHRLVWEQAHGPVPLGHIVIFRPGRRTTDAALIAEDGLELVSLAENMRRNTIHRYPQPVKQLMQLRGAIHRQINRRSKSA